MGGKKLTEIRQNGELKNRYTYGVLNRLEEAWNEKGEAAAYSYNGLGHRIGKQISMNGEVLPERQIKDVLDLTRQYHNLLQRKEGGKDQTFLWDGNVAGMETNGSMKYYLQDDLGSPVRLTGQDGKTEESYAFDEFGEERIYAGVGEEAVFGRVSGSIQPFTYTSYRRDTVTGTYYAQAREYRPQSGRFAARDIVKGYAAAPYTLNEYGYCWGNPEKYVDWNGRTPSKTQNEDSEEKNVDEPKLYAGAGFLIDATIKLQDIYSIDKAYEVMDKYVYDNMSEVDRKLLEEAIQYAAAEGSVGKTYDIKDQYDDEIIAWTGYWNNRLELDMDVDVVKGILLQESIGGTFNGGEIQHGIIDVMQSLTPENMAVWVLAKKNPNKYGYSTRYDANEGILFNIPSGGYPFLNPLFKNGKFNIENGTQRMSIVAGIRFLDYKYVSYGKNIDNAIEKYNGGGTSGYLNNVKEYMEDLCHG